MPTPSQAFLSAVSGLEDQKIAFVDGDLVPHPVDAVLVFSGPVGVRPDLAGATYIDLAEGKVQAFHPALKRWLEGLYRVWLSSDRDPAEFAHYFRFVERYTQARTPATIALIAICGVIYLVTSLLGGNTDMMVLVRFGASVPVLISEGQWWRIVGSNFLHIGIVHLLVNMYALWAVGRTIERFYGSGPFLALYALAGVGGALASYLTAPEVSLSAGASGAIFGLFGASLALSYKRDLPKDIARSMRSTALQTLGLNLVVAFTIPNLGHAAHLGGLVMGALFAALVPIATRPRSAILVAILSGLSVPYFLAELLTLYHAFQ